MEKNLNINKDALITKAGLEKKDFVANKKDVQIENGKLVISNAALAKAIQEQQIALQGGSPVMSETGISLTYKF